jgi:hypothetical protein
MVEKLGIDYFDKNRPLAKLHGKTTLQMRRKMYDFLENAMVPHRKPPDKRVTALSAGCWKMMLRFMPVLPKKLAI